MKVMIVDDSKPVRRLIATFLRDLVDEFVECPDGSQALKAYTEHQPDLVLMDIEMKQVNGLEATRAIKTAFPKAHVYVVSQWDSPALREAAKIAGAEGYVSKVSLQPLRSFFKNR